MNKNQWVGECKGEREGRREGEREGYEEAYEEREWQRERVHCGYDTIIALYLGTALSSNPL